MAQTILTALENTKDKLDKLSDDIATARENFYNALTYIGITSVTAYETFKRYADLIKISKSNPLILEVTIPDTTSLTAWKRTVTLPMYMTSSNVVGTTVNDIADEIIAANAEEDAERLSSASSASTASAASIDSGVATASAASTSNSTDSSESGDEISDPYGNKCSDGTVLISMEDIGEYLTEEEAEELIEAAEELGYTVSEEGISTASADSGIATASVDSGVATTSTDDSDTPTSYDDFEVNSDASLYSFTVDWGDGSDICCFDDSKSYTANKSAIWHTYESAGTYDITITGVFKRLYTCTNTTTNSGKNSLRTSSGSYVYDNDGVALYSAYPYGFCEYLVEVISWGNTYLTTMSNAFDACCALTTIPMYDTTNSFEDVTTVAYAFYYCTSLSSLPFNSATNKGLFSDCANITSFAGTFSYCTGYTGEIPVKLCDGCTAVTTVASMFGYSTKVSGDIPTGLFAGMESLTTASEVFANCSGLSGELSEDLFADSSNITSIYRLFYGCTGLTGTFKYGTIGKLSKLTNMRQAFYNCKGLTGFALGSDDSTFTEDMLHDGDTYDETKTYAFYDITANSINCRHAFYGCTGITAIPDGLISSMTGINLQLEKMFEGCTAITSLPSDSISALKVSNARGMFGGCTALASACPDANDDWSTYDGIKRWYGIFADTALSDIDDVCLELGGDGDRLYSQGTVGSIVLFDKTLVDPKDYSYDSSNPPIGIVYADVYLTADPATSSTGSYTVSSTTYTLEKATMSSGSGNTVSYETASADPDSYVHKIYACVLNDTTKYWTKGQANAVDLTNITNTTNVNVAYNAHSWSTDDDGEYTICSFSTTPRYYGERYTAALNSYVTNVLGTMTETEVTGIDGDTITIPVATSSNLYTAVAYCNEYKLATLNSVSYYGCFMPDGADLWDQFCMRNLINKACAAIISGGSHSSSTCYPMRNGTWYWASAEGSSTSGWVCNTSLAYVYYSSAKWNSLYVRPSFCV